MNYVENLKKIFNRNKNKRICVIGTTCTGKSTLIKLLGYGKDMDKEIFPLLSEEEKEYVCQTPWTEQIGEKMDQFVRTRLKIEPGNPMFGTVLLECDLILYLHISDELLQERTKKRKVDFMNAKNMQNKIEREIQEAGIETIEIEVGNDIVKEEENER